jgi:hypothetical protein
MFSSIGKITLLQASVVKVKVKAMVEVIKVT